MLLTLITVDVVCVSIVLTITQPSSGCGEVAFSQRATPISAASVADETLLAEGGAVGQRDAGIHQLGFVIGQRVVGAQCGAGGRFVAGHRAALRNLSNGKRVH